jgi:hypothetical protein
MYLFGPATDARTFHNARDDAATVLLNQLFGETGIRVKISILLSTIS